MKRIYLLLASIIIVIIAANIYYYLNIYNQQVNFQKTILGRQTEICSWEIEKHVSDLMNEINYILFTQDISQFFLNESIQENSTRKIEVFFIKYKKLITTITLYDNNSNVFNIFKDQSDNLITNVYTSREQRVLLAREGLSELEGESVFTIPAFRDNQIIANIIVKFDTRKYIESIFANYHIDQTLWQSILDEDGSIVFSNFTYDVLDFSGVETIISDESDSGGSMLHRIVTDNGTLKALSTYYPIRLLHKNMFIIFSLDASIVVSYIINSILTISAVTFIVLILIIIVSLYFIRNERNEKQKSRESEYAIMTILKSLPIGILIKGTDMNLKMINKAALNILKIDDSETVLGKDISNMFFLSRNYLNPSSPLHDSTGEFVYYDNDETEVILYKNEIHAIFQGEKVIIEAFMDISPIEQARKKEILFGEAKTQFLRKISYDIRDPLNGIINITDSLEQVEGSVIQQKDSICLIRKCCDDILSVVNDITDFSGFESGEIVLEEVPFVLSDEVNSIIEQLSCDLLEKNLSVSASISENVPQNLIGDPSHLSQILKTIIRNSIKNTMEGEVKLTVEIKKQNEGNILLEFVIEDTGKGISQEMIDKIEKARSMEKGTSGLEKIIHLVKLMKGELKIESPLFTHEKKWGSGTRISFFIQVYSDEPSSKYLKFGNVKEIRSLVLTENGDTSPAILKTLKNLGISSETTSFNESTADLIKFRLNDPVMRYSLIIIIDSELSNGFSIARALYKNNLHPDFLIVIISSVNKTGNYLKSKRLGADYYLTEPLDPSEFHNIIQTTFCNYKLPSLPEKTQEKPLPDLKILVAEDNYVNRVVAQSMFKRLGYEIDLTFNGKEALEQVRTKDYDIIFMDIKMPLKNGLDAAYEIRRLGYTMPIVAMTANVGETDKTQAFEVGMDDFISKPVNIEVLKNILKKRFPIPTD